MADAPTKRGFGTGAGRNSRLTEEFIQPFLDNLRGSLSRSAAGRELGIPKRSLYEWLARGKAEQDDPKSLYGRLYRETEKTLAAAQQDLVRAAQEAAMAGNGKVALDLLAKRFPKEWGSGLASRREREHKLTMMALAEEKARAEVELLRARAKGELPADVSITISDAGAVDALFEQHFGHAGARRLPSGAGEHDTGTAGSVPNVGQSAVSVPEAMDRGAVEVRAVDEEPPDRR